MWSDNDKLPFFILLNSVREFGEFLAISKQWFCKTAEVFHKIISMWQRITQFPQYELTDEFEFWLLISDDDAQMKLDNIKCQPSKRTNLRTHSKYFESFHPAALIFILILSWCFINRDMNSVQAQISLKNIFDDLNSNFCKSLKFKTFSIFPFCRWKVLKKNWVSSFRACFLLRRSYFTQPWNTFNSQV